MRNSASFRNVSQVLRHPLKRTLPTIVVGSWETTLLHLAATAAALIEQGPQLLRQRQPAEVVAVALRGRRGALRPLQHGMEGGITPWITAGALLLLLLGLNI